MNNNALDVWIMFGFGLLGVFLESRKVPLAPLILGMILGPKVEIYLRQGMIASQGRFFERLFVYNRYRIIRNSRHLHHALRGHDITSLN